MFPNFCLLSPRVTPLKLLTSGGVCSLPPYTPRQVGGLDGPPCLHGKKLSAATNHGMLRYVEGQREVFPRLEAAGMRIATCGSVDGVLDQLTAWGVPLRGRVAA